MKTNIESCVKFYDCFKKTRRKGIKVDSFPPTFPLFSDQSRSPSCRSGIFPLEERTTLVEKTLNFNKV